MSESKEIISLSKGGVDKEQTTTMPEHLGYDLGSRIVRFHSLTRPEVENIARDIAESNNRSVRLSASSAALLTFLGWLCTTEFSALPAYGKAVLTLGIPSSFVLTLIWGITWFQNRRTPKEIIDDRLEEYSPDAQNAP